MGLAIAVGVLADLREYDEQGYYACRQQFAMLNIALAAEGLPEHREPDAPSETFGCQMWGDGGISALRRIAASLGRGKPLPPPGDAGAEDGATPLGDDSSTGDDAAGRFDHLLYHSGTEGYYLPLDFQNVIRPDPPWDGHLGMIGSSHRLREECLRLAQALEMPAGLDPEAEEVWLAAESQGDGEFLWQRYGIETFTCLRLLRACEVSIASGCAIVFC